MKRLRLSALIIFLVTGFDQLTKSWVLTFFKTNTLPLNITSFFQLTLAWNKGVSFGILNSGDYQWILLGIAISVTLVLVRWLWKCDKAFLASAIALVIGGAIGNIIDRIRFQAVVDFISVHIGDYYWPAFNIADSAICIGVGMILLDSLILSKEKPKSNNQ